MSTYTQWQTQQTAVNEYVQNPVRNPYVQVLTQAKKMPWPGTTGVSSPPPSTKLSPEQKKDNKQWPLQKFLDTGRNLLPVYSRTLRSANDFSGLSFGRFESGDGYFVPGQTTLTSQVWAKTDVQQPRHVILPEAQRGGLHSRQLVKESWNTPNCRDFSFNARYGLGPRSFNDVYKYNSDYCRGIGISSEQQGSMPYSQN